MVWVLAEAAASLSAAIARAEHRDTAPPVTRVAADPANSLPLAVQVVLAVQTAESNPDGTPVIVTYTRVFAFPCTGAPGAAAPTGGLP